MTETLIIVCAVLYLFAGLGMAFSASILNGMSWGGPASLGVLYYVSVVLFWPAIVAWLFVTNIHRVIIAIFLALRKKP